MMRMDLIAAFSEYYAKNVNTLYGQNAQFFKRWSWFHVGYCCVLSL
jgi:hypothetical protein